MSDPVIKRSFGGGVSPGDSKTPGSNLPSIFTNRFWITVASDRVRISFGEVVNSDECHHVAVAMTRADAADLAAKLLELIEEHQAKEAAAKKKTI